MEKLFELYQNMKLVKISYRVQNARARVMRIVLDWNLPVGKMVCLKSAERSWPPRIRACSNMVIHNLMPYYPKWVAAITSQTRRVFIAAQTWRFTLTKVQKTTASIQVDATFALPPRVQDIALRGMDMFRLPHASSFPTFFILEKANDEVGNSCLRWLKDVGLSPIWYQLITPTKNLDTDVTKFASSSVMRAIDLPFLYRTMSLPHNQTCITVEDKAKDLVSADASVCNLPCSQRPNNIKKVGLVDCSHDQNLQLYHYHANAGPPRNMLPVVNDLRKQHLL